MYPFRPYMPLGARVCEDPVPTPLCYNSSRGWFSSRHRLPLFGLYNGRFIFGSRLYSLAGNFPFGCCVDSHCALHCLTESEILVFRKGSFEGSHRHQRTVLIHLQNPIYDLIDRIVRKSSTG